MNPLWNEEIILGAMLESLFVNTLVMILNWKFTKAIGL